MCLCVCCKFALQLRQLKHLGNLEELSLSLTPVERSTNDGACNATTTVATAGAGRELALALVSDALVRSDGDGAKVFVFRKLFTLRRIHNNWLCRAQANGKPTPTPAPATAPTATQQRSGSASVWRRPNNKRTNTHRTRIEQRRQHSALCIQRTPNTTRATTCCVEPAAAAKQRELNINNYVI